MVGLQLRLRRLRHREIQPGLYPRSAMSTEVIEKDHQAHVQALMVTGVGYPAEQVITQTGNPVCLRIGF
jgi:hypothetical protein